MPVSKKPPQMFTIPSRRRGAAAARLFDPVALETLAPASMLAIASHLPISVTRCGGAKRRECVADGAFCSRADESQAAESGLRIIDAR
jgi:hypothetical protein